jgi:hypothetical protein
MKTFYLFPLLVLSACSTPPKIVLRPQVPAPAADAVRYPEVIHAYHVGRYADPNDDLVLHERHAVYRVEENTRWNLQPSRTATTECSAVSATTTVGPRDAAFNPAPVSDAILGEVNAQRLATAQITAQARTLSAALDQFQNALRQTKTNLQQTAALRVTVNEMKQKLDALATSPAQTSTLSTTNTDALTP